MSYIAYINGQELEISDSKPIAQTKQVNDIASLESRQSNFTNTFTAPFTANNIKAMEFVYFVGNQSNIPYQKNEFDLIDADTGMHMIYKGWANVSKTSNKGYNIYVYDGNVDFYKAIENKTMGELDLTALAHSKTLAEVVATFDDSKPYKYILADYNGKALYDTNKINIDSLVPSVRANWLMNQIESYTGFQFNGSFKTNPDYINLWLTYPKGTPSDLGTTDIFLSTTLTPDSPFLTVATYSLLTDLTLTNANQDFNSLKNQSVRIEINSNFIFNAEDRYGNIYEASGSILMERNNNDVIAIPINSGYSEINTILNINDVIRFYAVVDAESPRNITGSFIDIKIKKYNSLSIDFLEELKGFTMRDFMNEIIWRFSLTLFKRKFENIFDFKTISEIVNLDNAIDWSSKFISKEGEDYIYGNYAQNNFMKYKYNDENANHNDGFLLVDNKNLDDIKTIIPSKIYSPELSFSDSIGFTSRVYKLWDKEPKDDGTVTYKELANRFYFMRSMDKVFDPAVTIGSPSLVTSQTITTAPAESFSGLNFTEIIAKNYPDIKKILNKSKIITANMFLSRQDVANVDFSVPYYIEQESGYFILNKILNFSKKGETKCELIKVT